MSQGMNDLLVGLSDSFCAEDMMLAGLEASICSEIISQRIKRNMTQKEFAEFMGVSQGLVSNGRKVNAISLYLPLSALPPNLGCVCNLHSPLPNRTILIPRALHYSLSSGTQSAQALPNIVRLN